MSKKILLSFNMEELSRAQFARLSAEEREQHLNTLLGTIQSSESEYSDSDDEDWDPNIGTLQSRTETSDNEMNVHVRDTEVEDNDEYYDDDEDGGAAARTKWKYRQKVP